ncbi:hypothetical protein ACFLZH_04595 [Patescibacteria group bacterium]
MKNIYIIVASNQIIMGPDTLSLPEEKTLDLITNLLGFKDRFVKRRPDFFSTDEEYTNIFIEKRGDGGFYLQASCVTQNPYNREDYVFIVKPDGTLALATTTNLDRPRVPATREQLHEILEALTN